MQTVLDYLQAFGLGLAVGVRPFLAVIMAGVLALANAGVDFEGTSFAFLESPWWLIAMAAALVLAYATRARLESATAQAALAGLSIGLGALLGAGTLDDTRDTWWPGLIVGAAGAVLSNAATRDLLARTARRLDEQARAALPIYGESVGGALAAVCIVLPPLAIVAGGFFVWLLVGGRRREGEKYAGLRILR